jgi:hypothetical protein
MREHERRTAAREQRVLERHPRLGRVLLRLAGPQHHIEAFAKGAAGEREVAAALSRALGDTALFLYNRRRGTGRERGDIDMIVVVSSGVWIVDPKKYARRRIRADGARETFLIDGRRRPHLAQSMSRQIDVVTAAVQAGPVPTADVRAAYCFLDADLPLTRLEVRGVPALSLRATRKALRADGPLSAADRVALHAYLARRFPPA